MKVLALDSTGPILSLATATGGAVVAQLKERTERGRGNALELHISRVLGDSGWKRSDVEGIGIVTGPGSLTGARIGWATATGWAQAAGIPVVGWRVPELQARRWRERPGVYCCVHYRASTFLLYDLSGDLSSTPQSLVLGAPRDTRARIQFLVGPGVVDRAEKWRAHFGPETIVATDEEAIVGAGQFVVWAEEALLKGERLPFDRSPLDYGLPPDFRTLASK